MENAVVRPEGGNHGRIGSFLSAFFGLSLVVVLLALPASEVLRVVRAAGGRQDRTYTLPANSVATSGQSIATGSSSGQSPSTSLPMTDYARLSKRQRQQLMVSQLALLQVTTSRLEEGLARNQKQTKKLQEQIQRKRATPPPQHHVHVHNPPPQKKSSMKMASKGGYGGDGYYYGQKKSYAGSGSSHHQFSGGSYGGYQQQLGSHVGNSAYEPQQLPFSSYSGHPGQLAATPANGFNGSGHYNAVQPPNAYYSNVVNEFV